MTPKEKAAELTQIFRKEIYKGTITTADVNLKREAFRENQGRRCAIILCEQIIEYSNDKFWSDVKNELQNEISYE